MSATIRRRGHISLRAHRPLEDGAEGELIRDVEHPQRSNRHVHVDRSDVDAERAIGLAPGDDGTEESTMGRLSCAAPATASCAGPSPGSPRRRGDEVLVLDVIVVRELDDAADRRDRRKMVELAVFCLANLRIPCSSTAR